MTDDTNGLRRLRRAEAVLAKRTSRVVLVLEQAWNDDNVEAVLRTAESFGVQHVWTVRHPHGRRRMQRRVAKGSEAWVSIRTFENSADLLAALREAGCTLWATDLSSEAEALEDPAALRPVPARVALIFGREVDGVSELMLEAAERRFYLPMRGFTESLNLTVATSLVLQRVFDADPSLVGAMAEPERAELRAAWYARLGGRDERKRTRYLDALTDPPPPLEDTRPAPEHRVPRIKKRARWKRTEDAEGR